MEEIFKPLSLTINKLLTDSDSLYCIPIYQRPYKWGDDEIDKLWDDILESYNNQEPNYFLGSIITAKPSEDSSYLDVVDGQQRLTTLVILMATIRDLFPEINKIESETDPSIVNIEEVKNAISVRNRFGRLRLSTHANHQSDFDTIIIRGNTSNLEKPTKKDLKQDEAPKFKFINTSVVFREKLEELGEINCGLLLNYIFNQIRIIRIDCSNVGFAIKLFQVLNARGLDLTNSDLIKSYLISKVHSTYEEEEIAFKEKQFLQDWIACENIALDVEENINDLFVMYEYYLLAKNPKKSLYDELEEDFKLKDPLEVISDFKAFIQSFNDNIYNSNSPLDYSFFYLRWSVYWKTLLTTAYHTNYPDLVLLKESIRRYYYLFWISGFTLSKVKSTTFQLIESIRSKKLINEIKQDLEKSIKENKIQEKVESALSGNVYIESWCKPLIALIEYNRRENPAEINIKDRTLHIEHILPKNFESIYGWTNVIEDDRVGKEYVNKLGNLTLLSGKMNIEASNNPFANKVSVYQGKGLYKEDDKKISEFRITQDIFDEYNQNNTKTWGIDSINKRGDKLFEKIEEILEINLSKIKSQDSVINHNELFC